MDIAKTISAALELPCEVTMDIPKITIIGTMRVHVENYSALLEYEKENIRLKYSGGVIDISGADFEIKTIGEANIVISGKIESVRLI